MTGKGYCTTCARELFYEIDEDAVCPVCSTTLTVESNDPEPEARLEATAPITRSSR